MTLPTSRDVTLTDASPVPSGLLNKMQDCIVALSGGGGSTDTRTAALEVRATAVEGRATTLEGRATSLEGRATALEGTVATLEPAIVIEGRATALEDRATALEDRATTLELTVIENGPPPGGQVYMYHAGNIVFPSGSVVSLFCGDVGFASCLLLGTSTDVCICPLSLPVGRRIEGWAVTINKGSASGTITARLLDESGIGAVQIGADETNSAVTPGLISLGHSAGLIHTVELNHSYGIVFVGSGVAGDSLLRYQVSVK